jgi:PTH2 family peptidyl-tRNA hydrolase
LIDVINKAKEVGLITSLITDAGHTEFNGVPTITCGAVGPAYPDQLKDITGHLPLL